MHTEMNRKEQRKEGNTIHIDSKQCNSNTIRIYLQYNNTLFTLKKIPDKIWRPDVLCTGCQKKSWHSLFSFIVAFQMSYLAADHKLPSNYSTKVSPGGFTSSRKAFLNPVMDVAAKALPGTQLTTTGSPPSQVSLDFSAVAWPSLQLDKWASFPVQFTE